MKLLNGRVACAAIFAAAILSVVAPSNALAEETSADPASESQNLAVLWTSGDPEVAHRVAFLYTLTAKKENWFEEVQLIIWGPSQRLLIADKEVQAYLKRIQDSGVVVEACVNCAEAYGVVDQLEALGIKVKPMGMPLTRFLKKANWEVITF